MRHLLFILTFLNIAATSCSFEIADVYKFGIQYNSVRRQFGSPLIKANMTTNNCCGESTIYEIRQVPTDQTPYHSTKTIRLIVNDTVKNEEDIYRRNLDDTTIIQLNLETVWIWEKPSLRVYGNIGKIDKRTLQIDAKDFFQDHSKFPNYEFTDLDQKGIDSVLTSWGLSRFDKQ